MINVEVKVEADRYGHVPGRSYHDVEVRVRQRSTGWKVNVLEVWGSCQGRDEEHGRTAIVGFGDDLSDAISDAEARARDAEIDIKLLTQAISQARDEAEEAVEDDEQDE